MRRLLGKVYVLTIDNIFMRKLKLVALFFIITLSYSRLTAEGLSHITADRDKSEMVSQSVDEGFSDDFYFVHLTDTHVRHKSFDRNQVTTKIFKSVIEHVTSFNEKPAFIVITGDLVEWGGSGVSGALNCQTFVSCLYEKNDQLYANADYSVPVYTTPGNHDYCFNRNLKNYHKFIDKNHIDDNDRYVVTYGDVSLFFMDSGPNYYSDPTDWLDILGDGLYDCDIEWLDDALSSCSSQHKIVLMHHPAVNKRNEKGEMVNVIARNREEFVELCETYDVDLVLTGHTHHAVVYDADENWTKYENLPLNCSQNPTLYVQSDDCKEGCHYRNITIIGEDIWLEESEEIDVTIVNHKGVEVFSNSLKRIQLIRPLNICFQIFKKLFLKAYNKVYLF